MAAASRVSWAMPGSPVPITLQSFAVILTGAWLGPIRGVASVAIFLGLGAIGLPMFAQSGSGTSVFFGPTGGYLLGFVPAAWLMGRGTWAGWDRRIVLGMLLALTAHALILACGATVLHLVAEVSWPRTWESGVRPFLLGGVAKSLVAALVTALTWRMLGRQ
jgi:biotin transport system substrate-specific component